MNRENNLIIKSNDLIQARYSLTLNEQKIILYAISKLDTKQEAFNIISINIKDFTSLLDTSQERYTEIREIAKGLRQKEIIIDTDKRELITGWLSSFDYLKATGTIELEFSQKLMPYLLQLKKKFTRYELKNILYLKNKYSIRLYELLKQYQNIGKRKFMLDDLREYLSIDDSYKRFDNLERRILAPAKKEINKHTDILIDYEKIKSGRRIAGLLFKIESKADSEETIYLEYLNKNYNIKQLQDQMGLDKEKFSSRQIINIYEKAVESIPNGTGTDIFDYVRANYLHVKLKDNVKNTYTYLLKAIENNFAKH